MSNDRFNNRVFGAAIVKANVANYNADFTGSPRTLPNGVVYATDKALKYCIRNYLKKDNKNIVFYTTRYKKDNMQPLNLDETYEVLFGKYPIKQEKLLDVVSKKDTRKKWEKYRDEHFKEFAKINEQNNCVILEKNKQQIILLDSDDQKRKIVLTNIFKSIDIRLFGATYASQEKVKINGKEQKITFSVHGNVQISHGLNIFEENNIFSEDITSPFRNSNEKSADNMQTTKGNQTVLEEGHYLHNFTINPKNTEELVSLIDNQGFLTKEDIEKFKNALNRGATYLDSASKIGVENEFSIFITLNENSKIQLPSFTSLIKIINQDGFKRKLDISDLKNLLGEKGIKEEIASIEIYLNEYSLEYDEEMFNFDKVCVKSIISNKELKECKK